MKKLITVLFALSILVGSDAALAQQNLEAHTHGEGKITLIFEDGLLIMEMSSPTANFLDFEHEPVNSKQWKALAKLEKKLHKANFLVTLKPRCMLSDSRVEMPFTQDAANKSRSSPIEKHLEHHKHHCKYHDSCDHQEQCEHHDHEQCKHHDHGNFKNHDHKQCKHHEDCDHHEHCKHGNHKECDHHKLEQCKHDDRCMLHNECNNHGKCEHHEQCGHDNHEQCKHHDRGNLINHDHVQCKSQQQYKDDDQCIHHQQCDHPEDCKHGNHEKCKHHDQKKNNANNHNQVVHNHEHGHSDVVSHYEWQCKEKEISKVTLKYFKKYPNFENIQVEWIVNGKQGVKQLNKRDDSLNSF